MTLASRKAMQLNRPDSLTNKLTTGAEPLKYKNMAIDACKNRYTVNRFLRSVHAQMNTAPNSLILKSFNLIFDSLTSLNMKIPTVNLFNKTNQPKPLSIRLITLATVAMLAACTPVEEPVAPEPAPVVAPVVIELSSKPIEGATKEQMVFAQSALTKLGYRVGPIDGIWGPWSAREIRKFEVQQGIKSADGFLSELNLDRLAMESGLKMEAIPEEPVIDLSIAAKLNGALADTGPQLIIVEKPYDVFSEPNPYSEKILSLDTGTGIYVINEKDGWYQVESINRKQGYVQVD